MSKINKELLLSFVGKIETEDNLRNFIKAHEESGLNFHPDIDYNEYTYYSTKEPVFTADESTKLNSTMERAFEIAKRLGIDIYGLVTFEVA